MQMYNEYSMATSNFHVQIGCRFTLKVDRMWSHVEIQIRMILGGLGKKSEDWVSTYLCQTKTVSFYTEQKIEQQRYTTSITIRRKLH